MWEAVRALAVNKQLVKSRVWAISDYRGYDWHIHLLIADVREKAQADSMPPIYDLISSGLRGGLRSGEHR